MEKQETNKQINKWLGHEGREQQQVQNVVLKRFGQTTKNFPPEQESMIRPRASQTGPDWLQVGANIADTTWSFLCMPFDLCLQQH
jgi:hypothetical protein